MAVVAGVQQQPAIGAVAPQPEAARPTNSLSIKVWRAVSYIFEVLARVSGVVVFAAVLTSSTSIWHLVTGVVLIAVAKKIAELRNQLHDFENPAELHRLLVSTPHMSFSEIRKTFNWADVKQHHLVPIEGPNGLKHKALLFLATSTNARDMRHAPDELNSLLEHGIIDIDIAAAVRGDNHGRIQLVLDAYEQAAEQAR